MDKIEHPYEKTTPNTPTVYPPETTTTAATIKTTTSTGKREGTTSHNGAREWQAHTPR